MKGLCLKKSVYCQPKLSTLLIISDVESSSKLGRHQRGGRSATVVLLSQTPYGTGIGNESAIAYLPVAGSKMHRISLSQVVTIMELPDSRSIEG